MPVSQYFSKKTPILLGFWGIVVFVADTDLGKPLRQVAVVVRDLGDWLEQVFCLLLRRNSIQQGKQGVCCPSFLQSINRSTLWS